MSRLFTLFTVALLAGCATVKDSSLDQLHSWTGQHYAEALYQLGRPAYVFTDRSATLVLAYGAVTRPPAASSVPDDSLEVYETLVVNTAELRSVPMRVARDYDLLYVDSQGMIYSYQSNYSSRHERTVSETNAVLAVVGVAAALVLLVALTPDSSY